MVWHSFKKI